ncbi:MAG: L-aspartate oxidase [bacterium]|nr:L-aspartate oxidase [bacterium]
MTLPHFQAPLAVFGTGIGGLMTARLAAEQGPVVLFTKSLLSETNTSLAQGGIAAVWRSDDRADLHVQDTLRTGGGIADQAAVEVLCTNGPLAVQKLIELGVCFDRATDGTYRLALEGAHSIPRILHAGGDATGAEVQRALSESVLNHPNIEIFEQSSLTRILTEEGRISGVEYLQKGVIRTLVTPHVVLATGGAGQIYQYTSNKPTATGEPLVMAYLAGGQLVDVEFFQFHPTALCLPDTPNFLISEAVRGEGAKLVNREGHAFMAEYDPRLELASRDIVSRAIRDQIEKTGAVFLDATKLKSESIDQRFPNIFHTCLGYGVDARKEGIPVTPVAHYMMGGLATDLWGRTHVPGLYAVGEVTRTGVHGSSRLASNSLLEGAVWGMRAAQKISEDRVQQPPLWKAPPVCVPAKIPQVHQTEPMDKNQLRALMWENAGLVRSRERLGALITRLEASLGAQPDPFDQEAYELYHMIIYGRMLAQAALMREESRGSHYRADFPEKRSEMAHSIAHCAQQGAKFI